jgi:hypothetical protein
MSSNITGPIVHDSRHGNHQAPLRTMPPRAEYHERIPHVNGRRGRDGG